MIGPGLAAVVVVVVVVAGVDLGVVSCPSLQHGALLRIQVLSWIDFGG